jgi:nucleotide-binding universal stress UspA family protein
MKEKMKILIGYDGTQGADAALNDLRRAGLPHEAEAHVVSVAEPWFLLSAGMGGLDPIFFKDSIIGLDQARSLAENAAEQIRSDFPGWEVEHAAVFGSPAGILLAKADEWRPDFWSSVHTVTLDWGDSSSAAFHKVW